jgi:hypothetical protein
LTGVFVSHVFNFVTRSDEPHFGHGGGSCGFGLTTTGYRTTVAGA